MKTLYKQEIAVGKASVHVWLRKRKRTNDEVTDTILQWWVNYDDADPELFDRFDQAAAALRGYEVLDGCVEWAAIRTAIARFDLLEAIVASMQDERLVGEGPQWTPEDVAALVDDIRDIPFRGEPVQSRHNDERQEMYDLR